MPRSTCDAALARGATFGATRMRRRYTRFAAKWQARRPSREFHLVNDESSSMIPLTRNHRNSAGVLFALSRERGAMCVCRWARSRHCYCKALLCLILQVTLWRCRATPATSARHIWLPEGRSLRARDLDCQEMRQGFGITITTFPTDRFSKVMNKSFPEPD